MIALSNKSREWAAAFVLFLFWPFGTLLCGLTKLKSEFFIASYVFFSIIFCWNLDVLPNSTYDDLSGIASVFMENDIDTQDFLNILYKYFTWHEDATRELYIYFIIWLTRLFSDNPHAFFAICSVPYLFFQTACLRIIIKNRHFHVGIYGVLILFLFILPRDIITVQNPRFTTALWLCIYVYMSFLNNNESSNKKLWLLLLTPLIHSSFWIYLPVFALGIILTKFQKSLFTAVYLALFFAEGTYLMMQNTNILSVLPLPSALRGWWEANLNLNIETPRIGTGFYWVPSFFSTLRFLAYLSIPCILWKHRAKINENPISRKMFAYYLYFFAFCNFVKYVPSLGVRSFWMVEIISVYLLFLFLGSQSKRYLFLILACSSFMIYSRYLSPGGTSSRVVPNRVFYFSAPSLVLQYWGCEKMNVIKLKF